jgi:hypothetical protein
MIGMSNLLKTAIFTICILFLQSGHLTAQVTDQKLEDAVSALRNLKGENLSDKEKDVSAKKIDEAWKVLIAAGNAGATRLKKEIRAVDAGKEKDDFFKLNATVVIWQIGETEEAKFIADVWSSTPISAQYNYVFYTAMEAARTKKPAVLPMLKAVLRDDKGNLFFHRHAMHVTWPLTHEFVWGAYGPEGLPALQEVFETSDDMVELVSAMTLLTRAQYLAALPRIRQLSTDKRDEIRFRAIKSLGIFGHPDDYDQLISGLKLSKGLETFFYAFALYEFDDERAVSHLIPFLTAEEEFVKKEVMLALLRLLTPESFAAVKQEAIRLPDGDLKRFITRSITLRQDKLPSDFAAKSRDEQAALLDIVRNRETSLAPDAKKATNLQFRDALKEWAAKGRIYGSSFDWVGVPQIISAATPADMNALLDAKSAFYPRLSDECLYETKDIDKAIKYISRSRYRKGVGVTAKAEAK